MPREWKTGRVSRTVIRADIDIRKVVAIWMTKDDGDEVGASNSR